MRTFGRTILAMALAAVLVAGCKRGGSSGGGSAAAAPPAPPPPPPPPLVVDLDVDTNRNGAVDDPGDEAGEDAWTTALGAVLYFNIDDDNNNNAEDHLDTAVNGVTDALDLSRVLIRGMSGAPTDATAVVSVSTAAQSRVRIFRNTAGTWTQVFAGGATFSIPIADIIAGDIELGIEARTRIQPAWDGRVTLTLDITEGGGAPIGTDAVLLRSAPWIMSSNLWTTEQACVVNVGSNNAALRTALSSVCSAAGITYVAITGSTYNNDRWVQDSHETGAIYLPSSLSPRRRVDHVLQCARWREVDDWCENTLFGPEFDFVRRFSTNTSSMNYGGNLEVTGPLTGYPWGRILVGGGTSAPIGGGSPITRRMIQVYRDYFNALDVQGPYLEVSSEWLAVGHVDEHTMVIPAPANPRGWAILIASPDLARQNLQGVSDAGGGTLAVFAGRTTGGWATTVDAILGDTALMTYNDEVQNRMDAIRLVYQNQLGLAPEEIIDLPVLFEDVGGAALAYNPGVVNMVVMPSSNGTTYLVIPDPEGPDQPADVWQAETTARIQPLFNASNPVSITYADVFYSYHVNFGEAHCGVNWVRTPPAQDWWDD